MADEYSNTIMKFKPKEKLKPSGEAISPYNRSLTPDNPTTLDTITKRPSPYKWSTAENIAVAATPMLIGLLTGEVGTGADYARKGLMKEQERELAMDKEKRGYDFKLRSMLSKEKLKLNKSSGLTMKNSRTNTFSEQIFLSDSSPTGFVYADKSTVPQERTNVYSQGDMGMLAKKEKVKSLYGKGKDALGRNIRFEGGKPILQNEKAIAGTMGKYSSNPDQVKFINSSQKDYSKYRKTQSDVVSDLNTLNKLVSSPNAFEQKIAIQKLLKQLQGKPSDFDYINFVSDIGAVQYKSGLINWANSEFNPKLIRAMKRATGLALDKVKHSEGSYLKSLHKAAAKRGIDKKDFSGLIGNIGSTVKNSDYPNSYNSVSLTLNGKVYKGMSIEKAREIMKKDPRYKIYGK